MDLDKKIILFLIHDSVSRDNNTEYIIFIKGSDFDRTFNSTAYVERLTQNQLSNNRAIGMRKQRARSRNFSNSFCPANKWGIRICCLSTSFHVQPVKRAIGVRASLKNFANGGGELRASFVTATRQRASTIVYYATACMHYLERTWRARNCECPCRLNLMATSWRRVKVDRE